MYLTSTCVGRVNSHCPLNECPPNTNKYITVFTSFAIFPDTDRKLKLWEVNWKCSQPGGRGWEWRSVRRHTSDSTRGQPASEAVVRPEVSARSSTKSSLGSEGGREGGRAGGKAKDCESMPHRPAVDDPLELSSLVEVADTRHGCGNLFGTRKGCGFDFYKLSHGNLPLTMSQ